MLRYTIAPPSPAGFEASFRRAGTVSFCWQVGVIRHWNDFAVRYGPSIYSGLLVPSESRDGLRLSNLAEFFIPPSRGSVPPFARRNPLRTSAKIFLMCLMPQPASKKTSETKKRAKFPRRGNFASPKPAGLGGTQ